MNKNNDRKISIFNDSFVYLSSTIITIIIGFLVIPIYTRYLTPSEYGLFGLFLIFGQISSGISDAKL